jgi:hypothetical protein
MLPVRNGIITEDQINTEQRLTDNDKEKMQVSLQVRDPLVTVAKQ